MLLAEQTININCVDNQGMAPLHLAAIANKELICSELVSNTKQADSNITGREHLIRL